MLSQENPIFSYGLWLVLSLDFDVLVTTILIVLVKYSDTLVILHSNADYLLYLVVFLNIWIHSETYINSIFDVLVISKRVH